MARSSVGIKERAFELYRKAFGDSLLGDRVADALMLENEAGQQCALFQIEVRCAKADRMDRIYH